MILENKKPHISLEKRGVLAVSHRNLTEGYRLFLGSFFIVKLESLFQNLADNLKTWLASIKR
jgi:hypothetical protein